MRGLLTIVLAVFVVGCIDQRQAKFQQLELQCKARFPPEIGMWVNRQKCIVDATYAAGYSGAAQDLKNARRMRLAEQVDARQITPAQAGEEFARLNYDLQQAEAAENTRRAAASAAILSTMPQPRTTTCTRFGNSVTCNGY